LSKSELITKYDFIGTGVKLELWGIFATCLGVVSITTEIVTRLIFTPYPPTYPDFIRIFIILSASLIIAGSIINYLTSRWMKKETQKELKKSKKTQKSEELQKDLKDHTEHFGYQLQKSGIAFFVIGVLTFVYSWVAVSTLLRTYTDYDVFLSLIIVTACFVTAAILLVYGEYWRNRAKKTEIT
jgi:membrane protein DedA with SNARE-associated domain